MKRVFREGAPILKWSDDVKILKAHQYLDDIKFGEIKDYQFEDPTRKEIYVPIEYDPKTFKETKELKLKRERKIRELT